MLDQCAVEMFCDATLLRRVMDGQLMFNTLIFQVSVKLCTKILSASIRAELLNLCSWGPASQFESGKSLALQLQVVDLHSSTKVISEADIVEMSCDTLCLSGSPQVSVDQFPIGACTILCLSGKQLSCCLCLSAGITEYRG
jgi:hypothetical protein